MRSGRWFRRLSTPTSWTTYLRNKYIHSHKMGRFQTQARKGPKRRHISWTTPLRKRQWPDPQSLNDSLNKKKCLLQWVVVENNPLLRNRRILNKNKRSVSHPPTETSQCQTKKAKLNPQPTLLQRWLQGRAPGSLCQRLRGQYTQAQSQPLPLAEVGIRPNTPGEVSPQQGQRSNITQVTNKTQKAALNMDKQVARKLKIATLNCPGVAALSTAGRKKRQAIRQYCKTEKIDILALQETHAMGELSKLSSFFPITANLVISSSVSFCSLLNLFETGTILSLPSIYIVWCS